MHTIHSADPTVAKLIPPGKPSVGVRYIPSLFALPFAHNGKRYAFHTLTKQCVEAILPASAMAGEGYDELIAARFLVPENTDECAFYLSVSQMLRAFHKVQGVPSYTILPTLACNARCTYCYEEGRVPKTMTVETADRVVRYISDAHAKSPVKLTWFGGEPLLCEGIIDRITAGLRDAGIEFQCKMVSNGSLITPSVLEKMQTDWNLRSVQISMDGAETDYYTRKCYYREQGQYHHVLSAIDRMSEAGIRVALRCNVDEGNITGVDAFLNDLNRCITHKDNVYPYLSPLNDARVGENDVSIWKQVIAFRERIRQAGFRPLLYKSLKMQFRVHYCMADSGCVVIGPDGGLYPCEHCPEESRFGNVFDGVTDAEAKKRFCRTDRVREMCRSCPFLPECTSFSSCPWHDTHCREVRMLLALDDLNRMIDKQTEFETAESAFSDC